MARFMLRLLYTAWSGAEQYTNVCRYNKIQFRLHRHLISGRILPHCVCINIFHPTHPLCVKPKAKHSTGTVTTINVSGQV